MTVERDLSVYDFVLDGGEPPSLENFAGDDSALGNIPAALASAAYGYTRKGDHSIFNAAIFAFFGYSYPLASTLLFAFDAVFIQETPAKRFAVERLKELAEKRRLAVAAERR